jgi:glutaminyl-peptide cyclotransferase
MQPSILTRSLLLSLSLSAVTLFPACDSKAKQAAAQAPTLFKPDAAKPLRADFSAAKAMAHVQAQVNFGPRPAGSEALGKCRAYLKEQLQAAGWDVQPQTFTSYTPKGNIEFTNLRARLRIADSDTWNRPCAILLGSHYDTKLFGSFEFVGANDGGSSTGVLLDFARVLGARKDAGQFIELVFFDGEEAVVNYTMNEHTRLPEDGLYGSRHYVEEMRKLPSIKRPLFFILLDMVGDKDLKIEIPVNSTDTLTNLVLATAKELNYEAQFGRAKGEILDDHHPFLVSGIKAVDIIDLDFKPWHTSLDKMESISEKSLDIVGQTTLQVIETLLSSPIKD